MTDAEIRALMALAEQATKGPWRLDTSGGTAYGVSHSSGVGQSVPIISWRGIARPKSDGAHNAAFIVAGRNHIPALCADLLAARAEVAALRDQLRVAMDAAGHWMRDTGPAVRDVLSETAAGAGAPDGWKLVPKKWTPQMEDQIGHNLCADGYYPEFIMANWQFAMDVWSEAYAAAPQPPAQAVAVRVE